MVDSKASSCVLIQKLLRWVLLSLPGVFLCYVQASIYPNECCLVTQTSSEALRLNQVSGVLWRALSPSLSAVLYAFPGHRRTVWSWQCQQASRPLQTPEWSSDIDTVALPEGAGLARDWLCVCAYAWVLNHISGQQRCCGSQIVIMPHLFGKPGCAGWWDWLLTCVWKCYRMFVC